MARKPSGSNRGARAPGNSTPGGRAAGSSSAGRAKDINRGKAGRARTEAKESSRGQKRVTTTDRSSGARADRAAGRRRGPASRLTGQSDRTPNIGDLRAGGRDGASEQIENRPRLGGGDLGATETSGERQGMGRGRRRNFDESDDDATTRGQSTADAASETRDTGVRRRSHATDEPMPRGSTSSRGVRSGRRSDW